MRVVGGQYGGLRLHSSGQSALRPTADRVKEALFNILGGQVVGATVVDLYAGTGGLGIEALSRGAERVIWVEREPRLVVLVRRNLASLGIGEPSAAARLVRADVDAFLRTLQPDPRLIVLADPPYETGAAGLLRWLTRHPSGYAVAALEHRARDTPGAELSGAAIIDRRTYGNVGLTIFTPFPEAS